MCISSLEDDGRPIKVWRSIGTTPYVSAQFSASFTTPSLSCQTIPRITFLGLLMASIEKTHDHDFWKLHLAQWQESGLSQAKYCRQQLLHPHQFSYWKCKLLVVCNPVELEPGIGFVRVQVATDSITPSSSGLSLCFPDGIQLRGITQGNMALIKQLIEVLR